MKEIIIGGVLALVGVVVGGVINGVFALRAARAARKEQEAKELAAAKESAYVEFVCFFNCVLQMMHPSVPQNTPGKNSAGMQFDAFVEKLCSTLARIQIYGSKSVIDGVQQLITCYNQHATKEQLDASNQLGQLNILMYKLVENIRAEISIVVPGALNLNPDNKS